MGLIVHTTDEVSIDLCPGHEQLPKSTCSVPGPRTEALSLNSAEKDLFALVIVTVYSLMSGVTTETG